MVKKTSKPSKADERAAKAADKAMASDIKKKCSELFKIFDKLKKKNHNMANLAKNALEEAQAYGVKAATEVA